MGGRRLFACQPHPSRICTLRASPEATDGVDGQLTGSVDGDRDVIEGIRDAIKGRGDWGGARVGILDQTDARKLKVQHEQACRDDAEQKLDGAIHGVVLRFDGTDG